MKWHFAIVLFLWGSAANAEFLNYAQWERLSVNSQKLYIAGVVDAFIDGSGTTDQASLAQVLHYRECLARAKMTGVQLAQNVTKFVSSDPSLQTANVPFAVRLYLGKACGEPPKDEK